MKYSIFGIVSMPEREYKIFHFWHNFYAIGISFMPKMAIKQPKTACKGDKARALSLLKLFYSVL
jgi:hypothetical protein